MTNYNLRTDHRRAQVTVPTPVEGFRSTLRPYPRVHETEWSRGHNPPTPPGGGVERVPWRPEGSRETKFPRIYLTRLTLTDVIKSRKLILPTPPNGLWSSLTRLDDLSEESTCLPQTSVVRRREGSRGRVSVSAKTYGVSCVLRHPQNSPSIPKDGLTRCYTRDTNFSLKRRLL